jgi:hypothetical protein
MRVLAILVLGLTMAVWSGCAERTPNKVEVRTDAPPVVNPPVEVNAPGVHVEAGGGKGVEVKAPGVDVETPPAK